MRLTWTQISKACFAGILCLAASACQTTSNATPTMAPHFNATVQVPNPPTRSAESLKLEHYYARHQNSYLARGYSRTDGGANVPFSSQELANNFVNIALYDEHSTSFGMMVQHSTERSLKRWKSPVRIKVEFGASVPLEKRSKDLANINSYAKRLARLTGHPVSVVQNSANFHVLILNENERRAYGPRLQQLAPHMSDVTLRTITRMRRSISCLMYSENDTETRDNLVNAVVIIRGEHPDLTRNICIHEELAQGMGLINDSRQARPSIFNDDQEFALLTKHDELLLTMLYDRRLMPGMTVEQARPIVEKIAGQLHNGGV